MARRRFTTHKSRSVWFQARATWPYREGAAEHLARERRRARTPSPIPGSARWKQIGPTNIGGRMTSVVAHPTNPALLWAGAAGGGVWQSRDAGQTWRALWS